MASEKPALPQTHIVTLRADRDVVVSNDGYSHPSTVELKNAYPWTNVRSTFKAEMVFDVRPGDDTHGLDPIHTHATKYPTER